jgi:hypothetical protein
MLRRSVNFSYPPADEGSLREPQDEESVVQYGRAILFASMRGFEVGDYNYAQSRLNELLSVCKSARIKYRGPIFSSLILSVGRLQALGDMWKDDLSEAAYRLRTDINECPMMDKQAAPGMVDALIVLSDVLSLMNNHGDALQSARLAVNLAHARLETVKGYEGVHLTPQQNRQLMLDSSLCVMLDAFTAVSLSYYTLGKRLEDSDMGQLAVEWYERAHQSACKFNLDPATVNEFWSALGRCKMSWVAPPIVVGRKNHRKPTVKNVDQQVRASSARSKKSMSMGPAMSKSSSAIVIPGKPTRPSDTKPRSERLTPAAATLGRVHGGVHHIVTSSSNARPKSAQSKLQGIYKKEPSVAEFLSVSEHESFPMNNSEAMNVSSTNSPTNDKMNKLDSDYRNSRKEDEAEQDDVDQPDNERCGDGEDDEDEDGGALQEMGSEDFGTDMFFDLSDRKREMEKMMDVSLAYILDAQLSEAADEEARMNKASTTPTEVILQAAKPRSRSQSHSRADSAQGFGKDTDTSLAVNDTAHLSACLSRRETFPPGHIVFARKNKQAWSAGEVLSTGKTDNGEVEYSVKFNDGDIEAHIDQMSVRHRTLNKKRLLTQSDNFHVGAWVWVNYQATRFRRLRAAAKDTEPSEDGKWAKAIILSADKEHNRYTVGYETGDTEAQVRAQDLVAIDSPSEDTVVAMNKEQAVDDVDDPVLTQAMRLRKLVAREMMDSKKEMASLFNNMDRSGRQARRTAMYHKSALMMQAIIRSTLSRRRLPFKQSLVNEARSAVKLEAKIIRRQTALVNNYKNLIISLEKCV